MEVIYEDNHIIIVNKKSGEIVQGDKTGDRPLSDIVKDYIKEKYAKPGAVFLGVVHRLDRPVSGLVVFARTSKALSRLNKMFAEGEVHKTYWAIVAKSPKLGDNRGLNKGQDIMIESFRTISGELKHDYPLDHKWALLHAIHTTADFDMEDILYTDPKAVETLYNKVKDGSLKTIVTDVTMVTSGIRKGAQSRLGVEAKCYLSDPRVVEMAQAQDITRTQAGIRLAVEEHPDALFAFGNAPTALMELCDLIRKGKAHPAGIIAAPVGFVHVRESKHMVKPFRNITKIIVEGRKGGSNLAATLCNAILTFDDAAQLKPGRDL